MVTKCRRKIGEEERIHLFCVARDSQSDGLVMWRVSTLMYQFIPGLPFHEVAWFWQLSRNMQVDPSVIFFALRPGTLFLRKVFMDWGIVVDFVACWWLKETNSTGQKFPISSGRVWGSNFDYCQFGVGFLRPKTTGRGRRRREGGRDCWRPIYLGWLLSRKYISGLLMEK